MQICVNIYLEREVPFVGTLNRSQAVNVKIERLQKSHRKDVSEISSRCFENDTYFDYLSDDKKEKKEKLKEMYSYAFDVGMRLGECFGAFIEDQLIGYIIVLDYARLKEDKATYNDIFDVSDSEFCAGVYDFVAFADGVADAKYILALCVDVEYQRKGAGFKLVEYMTKYYKTGHLISDVDNVASLSIYRRLGFDVVKATEKIYITDKNLNGIEHYNEK